MLVTSAAVGENGEKGRRRIKCGRRLPEQLPLANPNIGLWENTHQVHLYKSSPTAQSGCRVKQKQYIKNTTTPEVATTEICVKHKCYV